jgi:hypothetical protein
MQRNAGHIVYCHPLVRVIIIIIIIIIIFTSTCHLLATLQQIAPRYVTTLWQAATKMRPMDSN